MGRSIITDQLKTHPPGFFLEVNSSLLQGLWAALALEKHPEVANEPHELERTFDLCKQVTWAEFWRVFPYRLREGGSYLDELDALGLLVSSSVSKQRFQRYFEQYACTDSSRTSSRSAAGQRSSGTNVRDATQQQQQGVRGRFRVQHQPAGLDTMTDEQIATGRVPIRYRWQYQHQYQPQQQQQQQQQRRQTAGTALRFRGVPNPNAANPVAYIPPPAATAPARAAAAGRARPAPGAPGPTRARTATAAEAGDLAARSPAAAAAGGARLSGRRRTWAEVCDDGAPAAADAAAAAAEEPQQALVAAAAAPAPAEPAGPSEATLAEQQQQEVDNSSMWRAVHDWLTADDEPLLLIVARLVPYNFEALLRDAGIVRQQLQQLADSRPVPDKVVQAIADRMSDSSDNNLVHLTAGSGYSRQAAAAAAVLACSGRTPYYISLAGIYKEEDIEAAILQGLFVEGVSRSVTPESADTAGAVAAATVPGSGAAQTAPQNVGTGHAAAIAGGVQGQPAPAGTVATATNMPAADAAARRRIELAQAAEHVTAAAAADTEQETQPLLIRELRAYAAAEHVAAAAAADNEPPAAADAADTDPEIGPLLMQELRAFEAAEQVAAAAAAAAADNEPPAAAAADTDQETEPLLIRELRAYEAAFRPNAAGLGQTAAAAAAALAARELQQTATGVTAAMTQREQRVNELEQQLGVEFEPGFSVEQRVRILEALRARRERRAAAQAATGAAAAADELMENAAATAWRMRQMRQVPLAAGPVLHADPWQQHQQQQQEDDQESDDDMAEGLDRMFGFLAGAGGLDRGLNPDRPLGRRQRRRRLGDPMDGAEDVMVETSPGFYELGAYEGLGFSEGSEDDSDLEDNAGQDLGIWQIEPPQGFRNARTGGAGQRFGGITIQNREGDVIYPPPARRVQRIRDRDVGCSEQFSAQLTLLGTCYKQPLVLLLDEADSALVAGEGQGFRQLLTRVLCLLPQAVVLVTSSLKPHAFDDSSILLRQQGPEVEYDLGDSKMQIVCRKVPKTLYYRCFM